MEAILYRKESTFLERLLFAPLHTLTIALYEWQQPPPSNPITDEPIKVVCISDTHNVTPVLPAGDILIHAGDLSQGGTVAEVQRQLDWLASQRHPHKVVIAGNHDWSLQAESGKAQLWLAGVTYLQDRAVTLRVRERTLRVFGAPWVRRHGAAAFAYPADEVGFWHGRVPDSTDVLVTHMPPRWHRDCDGLGDESLLAELRRVRPALHVCGHIHAGRGVEALRFDAFETAYERSRRAGGSLWALLYMCYHAFMAWLLPRRRQRPAACATRLVNAACMGGYRDQLRRDAIVVQL